MIWCDDFESNKFEGRWFDLVIKEFNLQNNCYQTIPFNNKTMKRHTLLLILIVFLPFAANAQKVKFGVYADPQISWFNAEARTVKNDGNMFKFQGGLIMEKYFQDNYAINTGIGIGSQGGKLIFEEASTIHVYNEIDSLPPGTKVEYHLNYLTVPFGLKLKTNQIGYFSYYALVGFTNQFNIKAKATSDDGTLNKDVIDREIHFYNLAYHFGIGVEYFISENTAFTVGVVYHNGFLDITKSDNASVYSRVISIRVGVIF